MLNTISKGQPLADVLVGVAGPDGWKVENGKSDLAAHTCFAGYPGGDIGEEVHITEHGRATAQHFSNGEHNAIGYEFFTDVIGFRRPDMILQPRHQRQIISEAAQ